jgi:predicted amidohydrolase
MRNKNRIFRVAAVQMNSREDVAANLAAALRLIDLSADAGAEIVALPENFLYIGPDRQRTFSRSGAEIDLLRDKSRRHGLFILAGSILERTPDQALPVNTSLLINPDGEIVAEYQKIHLFDAELPGGESHRESAEVLPGDQLVVAETPWARIGLTICYDLRFPELYRRLALRGAQVIFVPSNFTLQTGKDHWLTLLRARAIENTVYLVAPAQIGAKADNRASFGKAAVIDPWGTVIALAPERDEFAAVAEIDLDYLDEVRRRLPTLKHVRLIDAQD